MDRRLALLALFGSAALPAALRYARAQSREGIRTQQGSVLVNGARAEAGSAVRPGDAVETGEAAFAAFTLGNDAFLLRERSRVEFLGGAAAGTLRLLTGKLLGVFGGGERRIETSTVNIGIRGTGAYLEAGPTRTYFCLCYGAAEVSPKGSGASETFTTRHHESPRYIDGDGRITPASIVNHTDGELIMLEALVGRTPPASFMSSPYMSYPYR